MIPSRISEVVACFGKVRYETPRSAAIAVEKANKTRDRGQLSHYRCRFCHAYHVGNTPR